MRTFGSFVALGALALASFGCNGEAIFTASEMLTSYELETAVPVTLYAKYNAGTPARSELVRDYADVTGTSINMDHLKLSYDGALDLLKVELLMGTTVQQTMYVPGYLVQAETLNGGTVRFNPTLADLTTVTFDTQFNETQTGLSVPGCEVRVITRIGIEVVAGQASYSIHADEEYVDVATSTTVGTTTCQALLATEEGRLKDPILNPSNADIQSFTDKGVLDRDRIDALHMLGVSYVLTGVATFGHESALEIEALDAPEAAVILTNDDGAELHKNTEGLL